MDTLTALDALLEAVPEEYYDPAEWMEGQRLMGDALDAIEQAEREGVGHRQRALLLARLAHVPLKLGRYEPAHEFALRALEIAQEDPDSDAATLGEAHTTVAATLAALGEPRDALPHAEHALAMARLASGDESKDTAVALGFTAFVAARLGDFHAARQREELALAMFDRLLGPDDRVTLTSKSNLAWTTAQLGDTKTARRLQEEVLEARRRVLGETHPQTLTAKNNLAATLGGTFLGKPRARQLLREVIDGRVAVLGEAHPDTRSAINNLAVCSGGDEARALLDRLERSAPDGAERHAPNEVIILGNQVGARRDDTGLPAARAAQEEVLRTTLGQVGENHPDSITALSNLGVTLAEGGDADGARLHFERALAASRRTLCDTHPTTTHVAGNLLVLQLQQRDWSGAWRLLRRR